MDEVVVRSMSRQRFNMWLMTVFGISALALAAIGIYGLMAYSVEQRTQEIGIRLALGADSSAVKNMVVFQGMRLAIVGVVVGIAASFGAREADCEPAVRRHGVGPGGVRDGAHRADPGGAHRGVDPRAPREPRRPHRRVALRVIGLPVDRLTRLTRLTRLARLARLAG